MRNEIQSRKYLILSNAPLSQCNYAGYDFSKLIVNSIMFDAKVPSNKKNPVFHIRL